MFDAFLKTIIQSLRERFPVEDLDLLEQGEVFAAGCVSNVSSYGESSIKVNGACLETKCLHIIHLI